MNKKYLIIPVIIILLLLIIKICINLDREALDDTQTEVEYVDLHDFQALTRNNKELRPAYFKNFDLTVIFFWSPNSEISRIELSNFATFCKKLPDNIGKINVILDYETGYKYNTALNEAGMEGVPSIISGDKHFKMLCDQIVKFPTTLFVNSKGDIVGEPIIGSQLNYEEFEKKYLKAINKNKKGKKIKLETGDERDDEEQ